MIHRNAQKGFTLAEVLIVIALLGILASIVVLNFGGSDRPANERALRANLQSLRSAVALYKADHGHWPCSEDDYGYPCSNQDFRRKLTWYSRKDGRTRNAKNATYAYGPYLDDFPVEPFSQADSVSWSLGTERLKERVADAVDGSSGDGGWYYEPESGVVVPNLGSAFPNEYARF
ncbi:MAG TPA: type II secretion system protein [Candidatus Krumholzibacteria bacterium]|nr:type II secretion system protein [Candidatus Krumholzibacteria bacterium]